MRIGNRVRVKSEWIDMSGCLRQNDIGEIVGTGESKNRDWEVKFPDLAHSVAFDSEELQCDVYSQAGIAKGVTVTCAYTRKRTGKITDTHFLDPFGFPAVEVEWSDGDSKWLVIQDVVAI